MTFPDVEDEIITNIKNLKKKYMVILINFTKSTLRRLMCHKKVKCLNTLIIIYYKTNKKKYKTYLYLFCQMKISHIVDIYNFIY